MVYVPSVPYTPPPQATLEAQELARKIEDAIAEYQDSNPRATQSDIQQALRIAQSRAGPGAVGQRMVLVIAIITGLMVALTMGLWLLAR